MDVSKGIELSPGTKISFYEVLPASTGQQGLSRTCVGYGGFGALYRVSRGSKIFALKLAHQSLSAYGAAERQWVEERGDREIAALKSLRHPNIVRVHAFDRWPDEEGRAFIVMDFVDGERLDIWRSKHRPSPRRICEVFIAIARALHAAHKQDIYHRDVKCANVLVRLADGQPVIVDWGISKPGSSYTITHANVTMGTFTNFAPEYCRWALAPDRTKFETTPPTELHAVGYMFYELLTGRGPFPMADNDVEMMRAIITTDVDNGLRRPSEVNPAVPGELDTVVLRLLEKEPARRYQNGDDFAAHLEELLARAPSAWDSPLDVPLAAGNLDVTRAEDAPLQDGALELSKDDLGGGPMVGERAPISIRSLEPRALLSTVGTQSVAPPTAEVPPPIPDAIAAAAAKVRATGAARRRVPIGLLVTACASLLFAGIVVVAALGSRDRKRPQNLLAMVEQRESRGAATRGTAPVPAREAVPSLLPPSPEVKSTAIQAPPPTAPPVAPKQASPSEGGKGIANVSQMSRAEGHHSGRASGLKASPARAVAPQAQAPRAVEDEEQPAWLKPVEAQVSAQHRPAVNAKFGIPTGAHIRARLLTNLDSRTVAAGPVEARLVRPFLVDGRSVFPSGTVLIGNAATSGTRFTIRFVLVRLPDHREIAFEGLAYDVLERKPGLAATRTIGAAPTESEGVAAKVAKEAANTVLTAATGGNLGTNLATGAGRTIVNQQTPDPARSGSDGFVLLLDAPTDFDVFVAHAL